MTSTTYNEAHAYNEAQPPTRTVGGGRALTAVSPGVPCWPGLWWPRRP